MFEAVLVANRGEIAVRIIRTLRAMGVRSVVAASIPDRRGLAVRSADAWVLLEGYSAAETYLDVAAVIAAAKAQGCDAIHPGYGFLAERADFAEACAAAGLTFIGPSPAVLRAVGDKAAARQLALAQGVPVVPGWDGPDDDETLVHQATRVGFPVMVKARGGGGGRGMREVHDPHALLEAVESARREAQAAFGDPGLLIEKLVTGAHHVEVQVVADQHGNVIHLGERDCSVQRRHQKLIEESPSPVVDAALRAELTGAALKLARAIGYVNAGTFEFLVVPRAAPSPAAAGEGRGEGPAFYFLEVNPRLQVEHPVTEMVTGLDLVELQLRVAAGERLPLRQADVRFEGHAIEFRINAEDPWDSFKPSSGRITSMPVRLRLKLYPESPREDSGYAEGDTVPPQYDSLISKRFAFGSDRTAALADADGSLDNEIDGVRTNMALLRSIVQTPEFRSGATTIDWLEGSLPALLERVEVDDEWWAAAGLGIVHGWNTFLPRSRSSPFTQSAGWFGAGEACFWITDGVRVKRIETTSRRQSAGVVLVDGRAVPFSLPSGGLDGLRVGARGLHLEVHHPWGLDTVTVVDGDAVQSFRIAPPPPLPRRAHAAAEGATAITAPLSGTVGAVKVAEGDDVAAGDLLLVLDAMKMEHRITAPAAGRVKTVHVRPGGTVREGDVLVELE